MKFNQPPQEQSQEIQTEQVQDTHTRQAETPSINSEDILEEISQQEYFAENTDTPEAEQVIDYSNAQRDEEPAEPEPISEQTAHDNTKTLIEIRENLQAFGLSYLSEGNIKGFQDYKYKQWEKDLLIDAWRPIVQNMNITVSPWIKVAYSEAIATTPLVNLAMKNRKLRLQNEQYKAEIEQLKNNLNTEEYEAKIMPLTSNTERNPDNKNAWVIDSEGYYTYNAKGNKYFKKEDRKEKCVINPEILPKLIEVNSKETIEKEFGIEL